MDISVVFDYEKIVNFIGLFFNVVLFQKWRKVFLLGLIANIVPYISTFDDV